MLWVLESLRRHPLRWWVAVVTPFVVFPGIDLTVSSWFYDPAQGFHLRNFWLFHFILKDLPAIVIVFTVLLVLAGGVAAWRKRPVCGQTGKSALYLLLSLAVGPGLLVNTLFKDHWHRARPVQVTEFGGSAHFTPVLQLADQCARNCSFSSGHGALGFWLVALALLAPLKHRPTAMTAGFAGAAVIGVARIAQGGHFLSDVLFSGVLVLTLSVWLYDRLGLERR